MPYAVAVSISERARTFAYVMSGPMRIVCSILGTIGNILSLIVFTRPSMMTTETNYILIGKFLYTALKNSLCTNVRIMSF